MYVLCWWGGWGVHEVERGGGKVFFFLCFFVSWVFFCGPLIMLSFPFPTTSERLDVKGF